MEDQRKKCEMFGKERKKVKKSERDLRKLENT